MKQSKKKRQYKRTAGLDVIRTAEAPVLANEVLIDQISPEPADLDLSASAAYLSGEGLTRKQRFLLTEFGLAVLEILLGLRFIFQMFDASSRNVIVALDYILTYLFVLPFRGIFGEVPSSGLLSSDLETLAAMLLWAVFTWTTMGLIKMVQKRFEQNI